MRALKPILLIVGCAGILMGILWIAQGTGVFPYPRSSFMINQHPWVIRGALLAVVGLALTMFSRRL